MTLARWHDLRRFTPARIALGRVGNGLPTEAHLAFQSAHAAARDAVHAELQTAELQAELGVPSRVVHSACPDRHRYLLRPDLGRRLLDADRAALRADPHPGVALVVCDGLSALAVQRHAAALLRLVIPALGAIHQKAGGPQSGGPVVIALQGRVALGDDIAEAMGAEAVVVLIGERPGLSTPDSLGAYLTWRPRVGCHDAQRNCISNIRPDGLAIPAAADKLLWLLAEMRRRDLSGVALKDDQPPSLAQNPAPTQEKALAQERSISVVST